MNCAECPAKLFVFFHDFGLFGLLLFNHFPEQMLCLVRLLLSVE
jgi:hypothetical protein